MVTSVNTLIWKFWGLLRFHIILLGRDRWEPGPWGPWGVLAGGCEASTTTVCIVLPRSWCRNLLPVACGLICLLVEHTSFLPALLPRLWVDFQKVPVFQEGSSNPLCSLLFLLCSSPLFSTHPPPCQEDCPSSFVFISKSFPGPPHSLPITHLIQSLNCPKAILDQKSQREHFYFSPYHIPCLRQWTKDLLSA